MTNATAPGKIILFGEHAVVYDRPAIAVPVFQVHAEATVQARDDGKVVIDAIDLKRTYALSEAREGDPIATIIRLTCARLSVEPENFSVRIHSTLPIGGGLGSGAAVSVAIARALGKFLSELDADKRGQTRKNDFNPRSSAVLRVQLSSQDISDLAYEVEKLHHGTPSGIDNTVIAFEQPVYFTKGNPIESFRVAQPFTIAIADTGIAAPTKIAVGDVRRAWEANRATYESLFDEIAEITRKARKAIENGEVNRLGALMRNNQILLRQIGVSSSDIERLVLAATTAGARGAKLSGGGRGGNVIALVDGVTQDRVQRALLKAGAKRVIVTTIS
ncbi:MAG: mevalonate kinase [Chloroflexi bacterium]|nr:mevalonate kinase [Chloroflexota bacterium]